MVVRSAAPPATITEVGEALDQNYTTNKRGGIRGYSEVMRGGVNVASRWGSRGGNSSKGPSGGVEAM